MYLKRLPSPNLRYIASNHIQTQTFVAMSPADYHGCEQK